MVLRPCGGKVASVDEIPEEPVPRSLASRTFIRWLVGPSDGAGNFYMRLFRVEPGGHINAHFHPWEHEIYILEGTGTIRLGKTKVDVREGFAVYIPPNVEHEYWAGDQGMRFICVIPAKPTAREREAPLDC